MYIDPNTGGMLFQVFAAIFAAITGIAFVFSRQIRSGLVWLRRHVRDTQSELSRRNRKDEE